MNKLQTKQIVSAVIVEPSETNKMKQTRVIVKFADSDLPAFYSPEYFNKVCARVGIMPAFVYSTPSAFQITGEFTIQKEGDTYIKKDADGNETEGIASSTSLRSSNIAVGMNIQAFGSVMAATANAKTGFGTPQNSPAIEETVEEEKELVDEIPDAELEDQEIVDESNEGN